MKIRIIKNMKLFYGEINKTEVIIHEDEQQHITKVLRMKEGEENAVAIKKGNSDLKEVVDKVIQKLKDDGTYQTYLEKAAKLTEVEQ